MAKKDIKTLSDLFDYTSYKLRWISDMYGYYWCHIAEIMPYAYICYGMNYELKKITRKEHAQVKKMSNFVVINLLLCEAAILQQMSPAVVF